VPEDKIALASFSRFDGEVDLDMHAHERNRGNIIFHCSVEVPDVPEGDCGIEHSGGVHHWTDVGQYVIIEDWRDHRAWSTDGTRTVLYVDFRL
jgi:aspartyl/asparaginyl beta-hydroxylase (cupin superfamily)